MESRKQVITLSTNNNIKIGIIPGHFATSHSHINTYLDVTEIKTHHAMAKDAAGEIVDNFLMNTPIDTIICLEGTNTLGAFVAQELSQAKHSVNGGADIAVISPELNSSGQIIFRDNLQGMIYNKNILLLMSSVSTGKSILRCIECLQYYNGKLAGVASIFSAIDEIKGIPIHSIFTVDDIPDYQTYLPSECPMCKNSQKIDAIANSFGYSKI